MSASAMNFNTSNSTLRQIMGNGLTYRVPPFQRDYSWTEDEWDDLWQDILNLFEEDGDPAHYMGYLVFQSSDNKRFDIIDGQQRLTTLSILILAALGHLQELVAAGMDAADNTKRGEQLRNSYIGYLDPVSLVSQTKLELNRHNNRFYKNYLVPLVRLPQRGLNLSEHQLRKAFHWFCEQVKERFQMKRESGRELAAFLDALVDKLFFTVITVTDELNAFKVFETLNARGVRLSSTDLLKNYLFSVINDAQELHHAELQKLEETWGHIVDSLGAESMPLFLNVFWNSRHKLVRKLELFKAVRKEVRDRPGAFDLLHSMDQTVSVYVALLDPEDVLWNKEERNALEQLQMFQVRQPMAMLLACYERFYERERATFTRILRVVATVSFRYNMICSFQANEQEHVYNEIAQKVSAGVYAKKDVLGALQKIYPPDDVFGTAFSKKEFCTMNGRNHRIVRFILFALERRRDGHDLDEDSTVYSIEHVLPEHPSEEWSAIEESKQERLVYRLGNMTLLETSANRDVGNKGYAAKRAVYRKSQFKITQAIAEHYGEWDEKKIEVRQKKMAEVACGIWRVDFADKQ